MPVNPVPQHQNLSFLGVARAQWHFGFGFQSGCLEGPLLSKAGVEVNSKQHISFS